MTSWFVNAKFPWICAMSFYVGFLISHTLAPLVWREGIYAGSKSQEIIEDILFYVKTVNFFVYALIFLALSVALFLSIHIILRLKFVYTAFLLGSISGFYMFVMFFPNDRYLRYLDSISFFNEGGVILTILYVALVLLGIFGAPIMLALIIRYISQLR